MDVQNTFFKNIMRYRYLLKALWIRPIRRFASLVYYRPALRHYGYSQKSAMALWTHHAPLPPCSYLSQFNHGYNEVNNTFVRLSVWLPLKKVLPPQRSNEAWKAAEPPRDLWQFKNHTKALPEVFQNVITRWIDLWHYLRSQFGQYSFKYMKNGSKLSIRPLNFPCRAPTWTLAVRKPYQSIAKGFEW